MKGEEKARRNGKKIKRGKGEVGERTGEFILTEETNQEKLRIWTGKTTNDRIQRRDNPRHGKPRRNVPDKHIESHKKREKGKSKIQLVTNSVFRSEMTNIQA